MSHPFPGSGWPIGHGSPVLPATVGDRDHQRYQAVVVATATGSRSTRGRVAGAPRWGATQGNRVVRWAPFAGSSAIKRF